MSEVIDRVTDLVSYHDSVALVERGEERVEGRGGEKEWRRERERREERRERGERE